VTELRFTIPGRPVPYERTADSRGRRLTPLRTRHYMQLVALVARSAASAARFDLRDGPMVLSVDIYPADLVLADVSNVAKSVEDGITKSQSVWLDDRQVSDLRARRMPVDRANPRVCVTVTPLIAEAAKPKRPAAKRHPWSSRAVIPKRQP
jgi:Holliday junction resolvase RusA-like endonuclease